MDRWASKVVPQVDLHLGLGLLRWSRQIQAYFSLVVKVIVSQRDPVDVQEPGVEFPLPLVALIWQRFQLVLPVEPVLVVIPVSNIRKKRCN